MNGRSRTNHVAIALAVILLVCAGLVRGAAPPRTLNYQGYLTNAGGQPINATVPMIFKLYAVAAGGSALYTETQSVTVVNGMFNVVIGLVETLTPVFDQAYFLEITAGGELMAPRQPLAAAPYALRAAALDASASIAAAQIVGSVTLGDGSVGTAQLANGAVTAGKLASNGCLANQVLMYNGSAWTCTTLSGTDACTAGDLMSCYAGTAGTLGVGICKAGYRTCTAGTFGGCTGQVLPAAEIADGLDNNCDGTVDEGFPTAVISQPSGIRRAVTVIQYTLVDSGSNTASVAIQYSVNGGGNWTTATRSGTLGDPLTGLATSPAGTKHTFFWAAATDGVGTAGPVNTVRIRITPTTLVTGQAVATADFTVDSNFQQVIGVASASFPRDGITERQVEVAIGDLIADMLRIQAGTQLYIVSGGGIRSSFPSSFAPANTSLRRQSPPYVIGPPYDLVAGDVYSVLPFSNTTVTRPITGAQLWSVLEKSIGSEPAAFSGFMQISGFSFTYKVSNPVGSRVQSVTLTLGGTPILANSATYTLGLSDFTAGGGDGYTIFNDGLGTNTNKIQADALLEAIAAQVSLTPATSSRITQLP